MISLEVDGKEASASGLSFMLAVFAAIHGFPIEYLYTGTSVLRNGGLSASQLGDVAAKTQLARTVGRVLVLQHNDQAEETVETSEQLVMDRELH